MVKEKLIGFVLIAVGALPFLLKIDVIGSLFESYQFLNWFIPGEIWYQVLIIVLGVLLLWIKGPKVVHR